MTHDAETREGRQAPRRRRSGLRALLSCIGIGLAVASVIQELRKSPSKRTCEVPWV
jgi:hypothetical protein